MRLQGHTMTVTYINERIKADALVSQTMTVQTDLSKVLTPL